MSTVYDDILNGPAEEFLANSEAPLEVAPLIDTAPEDPSKAEDAEAREEKPKVSAALITLVRKLGVDTFVTSRGDVYATIHGKRTETMKVRSKAFSEWLQGKAYDVMRKPVGQSSLDEAQGTLCGLARQTEKPLCNVHSRIAMSDDGATLWLDLANDAGDIVQLTRNGWAVVRDTPIRFVRGSAMHPLPLPVRGGKIEELRSFLNVHDDASFTLTVAWLIAAFRPGYPFPILAFEGEHGTGKSTNSRRVRALIDPSEAPVRSAPKDEGDLLVAATRSWVLCLDNLSGVSHSLSDALCRVATGGGLSKRALYTDDDEVIISVMRPILLNGIDAIAERSDLADRLFLVRLGRIAKRRNERDLNRDFEQARPRILGALLDGVASALAHIDSTHLEDAPRMADAANWATAAEPGLGWASGSFMSAWQNLRAHTIETALEASPVASAVRHLLSLPECGRGWTGTPRQLLTKLNDVTSEDTKHTRGWPKIANNLGRDLKRAASFLREFGYGVTFDKVAGVRMIQLAPPSNGTEGPSVDLVDLSTKPHEFEPILRSTAGSTVVLVSSTQVDRTTPGSTVVLVSSTLSSENQSRKSTGSTESTKAPAVPLGGSRPIDLSGTCPGCGLKTIVNGKCTGCGMSKTSDELGA